MNDRLGFGIWRVAACALAMALGIHAAGADDFQDFEDEYAERPLIADPLQPLNRVFYTFNDRLYFWVMKPVATGYAKVVPLPARQGVRNVFDNVGMPRRFVNCLLQGKLRRGGDELGRFWVNSTFGILGWRDVAKERWEIERQNEDTGQTLGVWGMPGIISLTLPVFGPSNVRDTVGRAGDMFLDPISYITHTWTRAGLNAERQINNTSLVLGEYERGKANALDHYLSLRDMYEQYRNRQIEE